MKRRDGGGDSTLTSVLPLHRYAVPLPTCGEERGHGLM